MLARSPQHWFDLALSYGPIAALAWGLGILLTGFYSPLTLDWSDWLTLLVGGVAVAVLVPLALAAGARWLAGRRRRARAA